MSKRLEHVSEGDLLLWGGAALLLYIWWNGGIAGAVSNAITGAGGAVIDAGVGAVDGIGQTAGLPPLSDITTDRYVARYIIDHPNGGLFAASKWSSAMAFTGATFLDEFTGHLPPVGSAIYLNFPPPVNTGSISGEW